MEENNILEYINKRLDKQIKWYDEKSQYHQRWFKVLKSIEITLGVCIPISSYLAHNNFKLISVALSSGILLCEGMISLFNHQKNWIEYRKTSELLKQEKYMYLFKSGVYRDEVHPNITLVERCETIISNEHINWANLQTNNDKKEK